MAHLTLQEVIDRVNNNLSYYSTHEVKGDRSRGEMRPRTWSSLFGRKPTPPQLLRERESSLRFTREHAI